MYNRILLPYTKEKIRFLLQFILLIPAVTNAQFQINFPVSRIVFQRSNTNLADVPFRLVPTTSVTHINVRLVVRQGGATTGWVTTTPTNGVVSGRVPAVQGGWYDLEAEAFNGSVSLGTKRTQRIGVGEVLIFAGQSNAQGFPYTTGAVDDRVSCVDFYNNDIREAKLPLAFSQLSSAVQVGPTNALYIYGMLGDMLVQRLGVPVLLYGSAWGGSSSEQWRQSAEGNLLVPDAVQWGGADELIPYRALKVALNHYVKRTGLRGIFWHQGESDKGQSGSNYVDNLRKVIQVSRQDADWPALAWIISRASWLGGSGDAAIVNAQNQVIAQEPYCFPGPNTDVYDNNYRQDQTHFLTSFYPQLAQLWNQALSDNFFQQSSPYVLPAVPPGVTVGLPQPAYQYAGGHLVIPFLDEATFSPSPTTVYTAQLVSTTGQPIATLGTGTQNPLRVTLPNNLSGDYQIRIISSANGMVSTNSPSITVFQPGYSQGAGSGLTGQYMSGIDSNGPVLHTQVDGPLDLTWFRTDLTGPAPSMPIRDYVIRWTGEIEAPVTGIYGIKTSNDDGSRVWINNQTVIDDWESHPWASAQIGQVFLQANQRYSIRYELLQRWFDAQARLQWIVPNTAKAVYVPKDRLYPATVPASPDVTPIQVTYPKPNTVFQRNNANTAQITLAGTCPTNSERIEIRISPTTSSYGPNSDSFVILDNQPANGLFSGTIDVAGGWYNMDVRAIAQNQVICHTRLTPVGVGEVFVIAGEANAQGVTPIRSVAAATDSRVICVPTYNETNTACLPLPLVFRPMNDGELTIGPHGNTTWCWSELGDMLTQRLNVPVLFYNVAWAGTTIRNWRESMEQGQTTTNSGSALPAGMPYGNLRQVLQDYVSITGLRAILWQQGETEYYSSNPQATNYATDLQALIARSRQDARFAQLSWLVARASVDNTTAQLYPSGSYEPVTNQQNTVIQTTAQVMAGPITDTIQLPRPDGKHLQGTGLTRLARAWNKAITDAIWGTSPAAPQSPVVKDMRLSMQGSAPEIRNGTNLQVSLTVSNDGIAPINQLQLRCSLPSSLQFISSSAMTQQSGYVVGEVTNIPAGQSKTISFVVRPVQPGPLDLNAVVIRVNNNPLPFIRCN